MITLDTERQYKEQRKRHRIWRHPTFRELFWKQSKPFHFNPRGWLIHRIRNATSHIHDGEHSHDSFVYWCGNVGREGETLDAPPDGRLICARCEAAAVALGQPPADKIVGRHVCIGTLKAARVCFARTKGINRR